MTHEEINNERALRAKAILFRYAEEVDGDEDSQALVDLLTDLRHCCSKFKLDLDRALASSEEHYLSETTPPTNGRPLTRAVVLNPHGRFYPGVRLLEGPENGTAFCLDRESGFNLHEGQEVWVWYTPADQFCTLGNSPNAALPTA